MQNSRSIVQAMRGVDALITAASFVLAYFVKKYLLSGGLEGLSQEPNYYAILLLVIIIWYVSFNTFWIYRNLRRQTVFSIAADVLKANAAGLLILGFVLYVIHVPVSRLLIALFCVFNVSFMVLLRLLLLMVLRRMEKNELYVRNVVIVGSKDRAVDAIKAIETHPSNGVRILGCFDPDPERMGAAVAGRHRVIGRMEQLESFLRENVVDELVVAMPLKKVPEGDRYLVMAEDMGISARIIPDWQIHYLAYHPQVASIHVEKFSGIQTLTLTATPKSEGKLFLKALFDHAAAGFLLVVLSPVFFAIALAIKASSSGPVFYRQGRLGKNGRCFEILKFRTMVADADERLGEVKALNECDGPVFKIKKDPRIIPVVGSFLRKTSLDELPQLINVVKGEMSLVGPRPPLPWEVDEYEIWHRRRLSMKPGITCLWQVTPGRNDLPFCRWVELDLAYIDKWSLRKDLWILFKTVKAVVTGAGR